MYDATQKVPQHPFSEQYVKTIPPDHLCGQTRDHATEEAVATPGVLHGFLIGNLFEALLPFAKSFVPQVGWGCIFSSIAVPAWFL